MFKSIICNIYNLELVGASVIFLGFFEARLLGGGGGGVYVFFNFRIIHNILSPILKTRKVI